MARPLGSGSIDVWIGFGPPVQVSYSSSYGVYVGPAPVTATGALYYGTTQAGPDVTERTDFYAVMNDITGPKQPMELGFAGREDDIGFTMSNWTQAVENLLENFLNLAAALNPALRGTLAVSDLGTMMLSEGKTLGIWMKKRAAGKAINIASGMPIGRYYPTCVMTGPSRKIEGNKENLVARLFTAKKDINFLNVNTLPLFREDDAAFVGLPAPTFG